MKTTEKPTIQKFDIEGINHITPANAIEAIENEGAILLDVREMGEIELEGIALDNIIYHPMSVILDRLNNISKDQKIIVVSIKGERSTKVANLLKEVRYPYVANLDGGLIMWKAQKLPYKINVSCGGGCSCGCHDSSDNNSGCSCS